MAKEMVDEHYDVLVFEELTDMRAKKGNKGMNKKLGARSFHRSLSFVEDEAGELGKKGMVIDHRYTPRTCSGCGHVSKDDGKRWHFSCVERGFAIDADLNASRNIAHPGTSGMSRPSVSGPNMTSVYAEDRKVIEAEFGYKSMNLFMGGRHPLP